jgi:hypothetical protein
MKSRYVLRLKVDVLNVLGQGPGGAKELFTLVAAVIPLPLVDGLDVGEEGVLLREQLLADVTLEAPDVLVHGRDVLFL